MFLFILSCRMELTAYNRNTTFFFKYTGYNLCETCDIAFYPSTMHNIFHKNMTCMNQSDISQIIQMNDSSFGMDQRFPVRELCELKSTPTACFCNDLTLFLISSLIADTIYDFFLGWWVLCFLFFFHSLIKSTLLAGKDLLCLNNEQSNTWSLVDSEFLFSCLTRCRYFHI